jgi:hypothetical protein
MGVEHRERRGICRKPLQELQNQPVFQQVSEVSGMEVMAVIQGSPPGTVAVPRPLAADNLPEVPQWRETAQRTSVVPFPSH